MNVGDKVLNEKWGKGVIIEKHEETLVVSYNKGSILIRYNLKFIERRLKVIVD